MRSAALVRAGRVPDDSGKWGVHSQIGALLVATNDAYVTAFGAKGSQALVLLLMDLQHYGYLNAQLMWLWLFTHGLLGYRSGMFPTWLSLLLMLGTECYVADALTRFLVPSLADTSAAIFVIPEILCESTVCGFGLSQMRTFSRLSFYDQPLAVRCFICDRRVRSAGR